MFPRLEIRKNDGNEHNACNVVENRRFAGGRVIQHRVFYLGKIDDSQELVWRNWRCGLLENQKQKSGLALLLCAYLRRTSCKIALAASAG